LKFLRISEIGTTRFPSLPLGEEPSNSNEAYCGIGKRAKKLYANKGLQYDEQLVEYFYNIYGLKVGTLSS